MRNKYKSLQNRGKSLKGNSFVIPDRRNQIMNNNDINNINKNSFISNFETNGINNKLFNKNNDKEKKRIASNRDNLNEKKLESNNTIKSSNHKILISVYRKESSNNKESIITTNSIRNSIRNSNLSKKIIKTRNENSIMNMNNTLNKNNNINDSNNSVNKNNYRSSKILFNKKRQNLNNNQNLQEKIPNSNITREKEKDKDNKDKFQRKNKDAKKIEEIEIKPEINNNNKHRLSFFNYRSQKMSTSYKNVINNMDIDKDNNTNKVDDKNIKKPEKKNNLHNYNSVNFLSYNNNKPENNNKAGSKYSSSTERNHRDKKNKLLNFRKIRRKENHSIDDKDDKSVNSPTAPYILSSKNNNNETKIKKKLTYRSKRVTNNNIEEPKYINNKEKNIINNNNNNNNNDINNKDENNKIESTNKQRRHIIVIKTPNEASKKNNDEIKGDDLSTHKKKIRHFLYFKSKKESNQKDEKEENINQNLNTFSPIHNTNTPIIKNGLSSPQIIFKKMNNKINKMTPKQSFKDLLHEANQNKNIYNSFSNIFQICKNDINNKNYQTNQNLNNSFTCISNELDLNLENNNLFFNYMNNSNINNKKNNSNIENKNNLEDLNNIKSKLNTYKSYSINRKIINKIKSHSPTNIIYKRKMNLIKSISNYYRKTNGLLSPKIIVNSNSNSNLIKNNDIDNISIKSNNNNIKSSYEYSSNISNNIINNNTFNTTLNIYKMNEIGLKDKNNSNDKFVSKLNKKKNNGQFEILGKKNEEYLNNFNNDKIHMRTNSENQEMKSSSVFPVFNENNNINLNNSIQNNNINKNNDIHKKNKSINIISDVFDIINSSIQKEDYNNENEKYLINLEILYILEIKFQNILNKINNYDICPNESFDLITYYFSSKFYEKEINIFKTKHNINNITYYIKLELLCYFLCYDICFNKSFSQTGILLKTIFNLLHNNYLIIISYILNKSPNKENSNNEYLAKLKCVIKNNLKINLTSQDYNENNILTLIGNNLKEINNYYKMIIDNLYSNFYTKKNNKKNYNDIKYKFPNCLQLDLNDLDYYEKLNIISLFFFDAYRLLNNYNFEDLKYFFDSFLQRIKFKKKYEKKNKTPKNKISHSKGESMKNIIIYKYNYSNGNFYYLPPIKKCYKYTLVLDLDETLVYLMQNNIYLNEEGKLAKANHTLIFRPGLIDFLKKMRPLYELVIFSFGTYEYVDNVIKIIEKEEKFFEHILYRQHATINNGEYIKDLSLLGRDLKNIIIVDDIPQVFKLQEKNGICIKAFYGDIVSDRNTLKILGKILEKIRFDVDEEGDIRKSLEKQKNVIFSNITNSLE